MKIGLFCLSENYSGNVQESIMEQLRLVELADELGFDEAWFGEHHFNAFSVIPDPAAMIAYAAGRTGCIRLGTAGFLAPFYHPVRLAESIALLDNLSGGRINAGFAKGGFAPDTRYFLQNKEELRALMYESVEAIDALLHEHDTEYNGDFVQTRNIPIAPHPIQARVPFFIATFSSEETIAFAARHGYGLMMSQGASLEECIEARNLYCSIAGYEPEMVIMRVFYVADTYEEASHAVLPAIDHFVRCMRAVQEEQTQPTFDLEAYELLLNERKGFFNGQKFFDNAILGTPEQCIATIKTIQKELNHVHLVLKPSSTDHTQNRWMLSQFNTQIRPYI
ncbi:MAG: LLM class flavin-dependent oxidoreductase [Sulfuricurvum sp.]|uniref:LLM class flavin-dependent oxidoreductase n=1 Tax=Sulfuricurvum sp. TaxID=2025608 RepID=UPI0025FA3459|nr:LLM class flavin-dependent oxidoreductase [Sulfuricurvum sp.]MBV5320367.1 LLM class flavin-dependent oxidoreductase [Sulfuricurvum sp.]